MSSYTKSLSTPPETGSDTTWLRLARHSLTLGAVAAVFFACVGAFFSTISEGDFRYRADYWYTGAGLPLAVAGIGLTLAVHRLQHGADGRLGTIGLWVNALALTELFVQLSASVIVGSELRWGPLYVLCSFLTFAGTALLAAGSWRTGLLPRWVLGAWPVLWILGTFAGTPPVSVLLAGFLVAFGVILTRRVHDRTAEGR